MLGYLVLHGWPLWRAFLVVILLGAAAGVFNGLLDHAPRAPVARRHDRDADALPRLRGRDPRPEHRLDLPRAVHEHRVNGVAGTFLSWSIVFFLILAVIFGVVLHLTPFGRSLFVMGLNKDAAIYAGIRVKRIKLLLFVVSGLICAFAGILYTFRLSTAVQDNGLGLELNVVAIVLLGGVSIFGGRGTIVGVVLAVFVYAALQNALFLTNFPQRAFGIVTGCLLLLSVLIPNAGSFSSVRGPRWRDVEPVAGSRSRPTDGAPDRLTTVRPLADGARHRSPHDRPT